MIPDRIMLVLAVRAQLGIVYDAAAREKAIAVLVWYSASSEMSVMEISFLAATTECMIQTRLE